MYLCIAPLGRFYYPETRRFINAFYYYYYYYYYLSGDSLIVKNIYLLGSEICETDAIFRPTSMGLDHTFASDATLTLADKSCCRWGVADISDHYSWWVSGSSDRPPICDPGLSHLFNKFHSHVSLICTIILIIWSMNNIFPRRELGYCQT